MPPNVRWSDREKEILKQLDAVGATLEEARSVLKSRSKNAIRDACRVLELYNIRSHHIEIDEEELQAILRLRKV